MAAPKLDCFVASARRNDGEGTLPALLPHPFRRALFRKRLLSPDIILRDRHRPHGRVFALLGDSTLPRQPKNLLEGLLGRPDPPQRTSSGYDLPGLIPT